MSDFTWSEKPTVTGPDTTAKHTVYAGGPEFMFLQFAQQVTVYRGIRLTQNVSSYDMIMIPEMKGLSTGYHINDKLL